MTLDTGIVKYTSKEEVPLIVSTVRQELIRVTMRPRRQVLPTAKYKVF